MAHKGPLANISKFQFDPRFVSQKTVLSPSLMKQTNKQTNNKVDSVLTLDVHPGVKKGDFLLPVKSTVVWLA